MIIFVGVAGSGKSSQGKLLAADLKIPYFSMGEFLRSHLERKFDQQLKMGDLVSDETAIDILDAALEESQIDGKEFILDGFPRTLPQTEWLVDRYKKGQIKINTVFHLIAKPEVVINRLLVRNRPDDNVPAINKRIDEYKVNIDEIVRDLREGGVTVFDVDAEEVPEHVHKVIMDRLSK